MPRNSYVTNLGSEPIRGTPTDSFGYRLFAVQKNSDSFNDLLAKVLHPLPKWQIEQTDTGQYYIRFEVNGLYHGSEGAGDGLVSLLFLIDALHDSRLGSAIAIDEPEMSLHPAVQRRLAQLFLEYSSTRQIILATHSPYFLPMEALGGGMRVARIYADESGSHIAEVSPELSGRLSRLVTDLNNPHVLDLSAREVFFLHDRVILVEGQEDVVFYRRLAEHLGQPFQGDFFGWGAGGAEKMSVFAELFQQLGYRKVVGILDGNKVAEADRLRAKFSDFTFVVIPAEDVRSKPARELRPAVKGLLSQDGTLPPEHRGPALDLMAKVNAALT